MSTPIRFCEFLLYLVISPSLFDELVVPLLGDSDVLLPPTVVPPDVPGVPVVKEKMERVHS